MRIKSVLACFIAATALAACATPLMTEAECLAGDWYAAGLEDGAAGRRIDALDERAGLCAAVGAAPDARAYADGRDAALLRLCNSASGYEFGLEGRQYYGVCRPDLEPDFLGGYLLGRRLYGARALRADAEDNYGTALYSLDYELDQIERARLTLAKKDASQKDIKRARRVLKSADATLDYERRRVDEALRDLNRSDARFNDTVRTQEAYRASAQYQDHIRRLISAYTLARNEPAIAYCRDTGGATPACELRPGGRIIDDQTSAVCAVGPGEAQLYIWRNRALENGAEGEEHAYNFLSRAPDTGRLARCAAAGFVVFFDERSRATRILCADAGPAR